MSLVQYVDVQVCSYKKQTYSFFSMHWSACPKIMRSTAGRKRQLKRKRRGGYARAFQIHASPVRFMLGFEIPKHTQ